MPCSLFLTKAESNISRSYTNHGSMIYRMNLTNRQHGHDLRESLEILLFQVVPKEETGKQSACLCVWHKNQLVTERRSRSLPRSLHCTELFGEYWNWFRRMEWYWRLWGAHRRKLDAEMWCWNEKNKEFQSNKDARLRREGEPVQWLYVNNNKAWRALVARWCVPCNHNIAGSIPARGPCCMLHDPLPKLYLGFLAVKLSNKVKKRPAYSDGGLFPGLVQDI